MQIRYKIQSCSSSAPSTPASNLSAHQPWQSERFCDYPQQLTISFYQPARIDSIKIATHPYKVPTRINILYHLPQTNDKGYQKYGYVSFIQPQEHSVACEVKEIKEVGITASEVRLLLLRNYQVKNNVFSQVGLTQLQFSGQPVEHLVPAISRASISRGFQAQSTLLMQLKQNFVRREQYEQAKQIREMQLVLQRASGQLEELQRSKQRCVKEEDYMGAKRVREEILQLKSKVAELASRFYSPGGQEKMVRSDLALRQKIEEMGLTPISNSMRVSRAGGEDVAPLKDVGEAVSEDEDEDGEEDGREDRNQSMVSHEDRILPAVMNRMRGLGQTQPIPEASEVGDNQFFQAGDKSTLPVQPEPLGPADQSNSSLLLQFYQPLFIRRLHSRHWQFRMQALTMALQQLKANQNSPGFLTKPRVRCYLFIYSTVLKIHSFKTTMAALDLMDLFAQCRPQGQSQKQLHNELEAAVRGTVKVAADSNQKIRNHSEKTILRMIESAMFGVPACYYGLIKSYPEKGAARLKKIRINNLAHLVEKYGVGEGAVPASIADFALRTADDQELEVRKAAVELAKAVRTHGGKQKLEALLAGSRIRSSVANQLEQS